MNPEAALRAAIPDDVATLMGRIHARGFSVFAVGGAVRDVLAGRTPVDWDLATSATPDQLRAAFHDAEYENRFGTVGIPTGVAVREVTTFRTDGPSSDARRPDDVRFIQQIDGDLARRDFTVNAMAFGLAGDQGGDPVADGALVDPHGGREDLDARVLRAVGDAAERFKEDALRVLRAARFASRFELTIHPATAAAIRDAAGLTGALSGERIGSEIDGILASAHPEIGLAALRDLGVIRVLAPELDERWESGLPQRVAAVGASDVSDAPDPLGRLAELLAPISSDETAEALLVRWRRPRATIHAVAHVRLADRLAEEAERSEIDHVEYRVRVAALTGDPHDAARQIRRRLAAGRATQGASALLAGCQRADAQKTPALAADLAVDGAELARHVGAEPGAWIKEMQSSLLCAVGRDEIPNLSDALLAAARRIRAQKG